MEPEETPEKKSQQASDPITRTEKKGRRSLAETKLDAPKSTSAYGQFHSFECPVEVCVLRISCLLFTILSMTLSQEK